MATPLHRDWMTVTTLADALALLLPRLTYKPNTRFEMKVEGESGWVALAVCDLPDSRGGDPFPMLRFSQQFPVGSTYRSESEAERAALTCVDLLLTAFEEHEKDEWLRLDGRIVTDPHRLGLVGEVTTW